MCEATQRLGQLDSISMVNLNYNEKHDGIFIKITCQGQRQENVVFKQLTICHPVDLCMLSNKYTWRWRRLKGNCIIKIVLFMFDSNKANDLKTKENLEFF